MLRHALETLRKRLGPEDGQAIVLVLLMLPVIFFVGALVVDSADLYVQKRAAQSRADAVALALSADLQSSGCLSTCAADGNYYFHQNGGDPSITFHKCDDGSGPDTNCYVNPYRSDPGLVQVRVSTTPPGWFARAAYALAGETYAGFAASAKAAAGANQGAPPPISFASLNSGGATCGENHSLIMRAGGNLTVENTVYVDSCNDHDGFDIKGDGGKLTAPLIYTVGGWEFEGSASPQPEVWSKYNPSTFPTLSSTSTKCSTGGQTKFSPPWTGSGCPITGYQGVADPFAAVTTPPLGPPAWGSTAPVLVTKMSRKSGVATLTTGTAHGLSAGQSVTVNGVGSAFDGIYTVLASPAPTSTTFSYTQTGLPDLPTITNEQFTMTSGSSGTVTLTTSTPHMLSVGDTVTVSGMASLFNGVNLLVTGVTPTTFSYAKARTPFNMSVSKKGLASGVATLTVNSTASLVVGDSVTVSNVDALLNGQFVVTSIPSGTTFTYADPALMGLTVTNKTLLTQTTAQLTTSAQHHLAVGDPVTVSIGDARFDGNFTVTKVVSNTVFQYTVPAVVETVTNKVISGGTATLTTSSGPRFQNGDSVTVAIGDGKYDGTYTVTAVNAAAHTFSYIPATFQTTAWTWTSATRTVTETTPQALQAGDTITVSGYGGAQTCLNGTFTVASAPNSSTFTYVVPSGVTCNPGASGTQKGTIALQTSASAAASGNATLSSLASTISVANGATVAGFITAATAVSPAGTAAASGNVPSTAATGSFTPAWSPAPTGAYLSANNPGSAAVPSAYLASSGNVTLTGGTYYGGLCIGAPAGKQCGSVVSGNCQTPDNYTATAFSPAQTLSGAITAAQTTITVSSGTPVKDGDYIQIQNEKLLVTAGGGTASLTVQRGVLGTTAAAHATGTAVTYIVGTAHVTLNDGTYIMAGGGFFVCGASTIYAPHVMVYNTQDPPPYNTGAGAIDQIEVNTTGTVTIGAQSLGFYKGMTLFVDPSLGVAPGITCGSKTGFTTAPTQAQINEWDVALMSMAPVTTPTADANGALGSITGTLYSPNNHAEFAVSVSGTTTLAVISSCILIDASDSTFKFTPDKLFGLGTALTE